MAEVVTCLYTDDENRTWRVRRHFRVYVQFPTLFGFTADDGVSPWLPHRLKMRYVLFVSTSVLNHRTVTIGNRTCAAWVDRPITLTLPTADGSFDDFASQSWFGERQLAPL